MNIEEILDAKFAARNIYEGMQAAYWSTGDEEHRVINAKMHIEKLVKAMGYRIERITDDEKSEETA